MLKKKRELKETGNRKTRKYILIFIFLSLLISSIFGVSFAAETEPCDHSNTRLESTWKSDRSGHRKYHKRFCNDCGAFVEAWSDNFGDHSIETDIDRHQSYCIETEEIDCSTCGYYKEVSSTRHSHTRGSNCSTCGKYYPTHEEEANGYIDGSNDISVEGENLQDNAEGQEIDAENNLGEGEVQYNDSWAEYDYGNIDFGSAVGENNHSNDSLGLSDNQLQNVNYEIGNSDISNENSQVYIDDSVILEDESWLLYEEVENSYQYAMDTEEEVNIYLENSQQQEEGNTDTINTENNINDSGETGDPVKYTTGEYVSKSTDIKINNTNPPISIIRNYKNFKKNSFSFGKGWSFNYDTRIIHGIRPDYVNYQETLEDLLSDIETIYTEACEDYQDAMEAANESKRLAELSVEEAVKAVNYAENGKTAAENAEYYANTANNEAELAEEFASDALGHIEKSRDYASNAIDLGSASESYAIEAKNIAESAGNKAEQAITIANSAIYHADQSGDQTVINNANMALERAETLKDRVQTTLINLNGSEAQGGVIAVAETLQIDSQTILDNIVENDLENKINIEVDNAAENKGTAESKIVEAGELHNLAEDTFQKALATKEKADNRLAETNSWLTTLSNNIEVIEQIEKWKDEIFELEAQAQLDKEYSEIYRYRNEYNVDWNANPDRDEIGISKLILVDEAGTPHIYDILNEPDFETEVRFPDGRKNYYPNGSQTEAVNPSDDKVEIMSDGSYLLTKKDGTRYSYSYFGQLSRIEDTNNRYLDFTYNTEHQLVKITDSFDRELIISRSNGKIVKITDPIGRTYSYGYSGDRLVSYTDPDGNTRRYTYNEYGLTSTIYPDGNGWEYYYKELDGRMVMDYQTDASGAEIAFEYNPDAQQTTVTNRRGYKRSYNYTDKHLTTDEIDADHRRVMKTYDQNNNLISVTNKRGYTTTYTYDDNNNITSITDSVGTTSFSYNQFNKISTLTDKKGNTSSYSYDYKGNLTLINYPDGTSMSFGYNNLGLLITETDQRGNQTRYSYDDYGNVKEKIYPDGSIEEFQYDKIGRLIKLTKANGGEITYTYDNNDNIIKVVDELGNEESFKYNSRNKIIEKTDPNGNITKYEYDERNNLSTVTDPAGNVQEIEYDEAENMTKKIFAENISYIYQYDKLDRLTTTTQVETDIETSYQYDPTGNITALIDGEGRTSSFEYDAVNRKIREKDPLNNLITYRYYADNTLKSVTDKKGNTTYFKYDSMGRLVEAMDVLDQKIRYKYDSTGNMTAKTDARGNTTRYEYDSMNRMIKEIDPLGNETTYQYDQAGNLVSITDPEDNTLKLKYDLKGRVIEETNALGDSKHFEYDGVGNLLSETNEAGITTQYRYDQLNRLIEIEDSLANITKVGYTTLGKIAWREDALGNRVEFEYDSANRLIKETDPEGNSIEYSYDKAGNLIAEIDQMGNIKEYHYDQLNRMIEAVDPLDNKVKYSYDANGNLIEMVNKNGKNYQYQYDDLDRLVNEINYLGNEQNYSYDPNGNLKVKADFNGNSINYNYDELNRLLEAIFADGSKKEFNYNANGQMTSAVNENSNQRYYYDQLSRLIKVEIENETDEYTVEYQYNELGQRTKVVLDDEDILKDRATKYEYDEAMRLNKVELPDGEVVKYSYDELNRVITQINSNRTGTNYSYTPDGQVETISHFKGLNGHNEKALQSYGYIYNDRNQRLMEVEGSGEITTYQYDPVGRLSKVYYPFSGGKKEVNRIERSNYFGLKANLGNQKEYYRQKHNPDQYISEITYQLRNEVEDLHKEIRENGRSIDFYNNGYYIEEYKYDPAGNVVQEANAWGTIDFKYNSANQLIEAGDRSYSYDKNGNLIKDGHKNNYAEYSYNYENRLIKASNLSKDNKLLGGEHPFKGTIEYSYDALGRKVSKQLIEVSGYYYDGRASNVLAEYENLIWNMKQYHKGKKNGNGNIQGGQIKHFNEYYYGNGLIAFNSMNNPNPWNIRPDVNFYHKDSLGSITAITGKNGNVVGEYKYGAYGNPYQGRFLNMQKNNPYGFTGQRYEAELRMYSFAYRTYNPVSMRWMTQDPVRDGTNWYQYCMSDPVNFIDPDGRVADPVSIVVGGSAVLAVGVYIYATNPDVNQGFTDALYEGGKVVTETVKKGYEKAKDSISNISRQKEGDVALREVLPKEDPLTNLDINTSRRLSGNNGSNDPNNNDKDKMKKIIKGTVIVGMVTTAVINIAKPIMEINELNDKINDKQSKNEG